MYHGTCRHNNSVFTCQPWYVVTQLQVSRIKTTLVWVLFTNTCILTPIDLPITLERKHIPNNGPYRAGLHPIASVPIDRNFINIDCLPHTIPWQEKPGSSYSRTNIVVPLNSFTLPQSRRTMCPSG